MSISAIIQFLVSRGGSAEGYEMRPLFSANPVGPHAGWDLWHVLHDMMAQGLVVKTKKHRGQATWHLV